MAQQAHRDRVLEGTWEEVSSQAASISPEQRVRLELLSGTETGVRREEQARAAHVGSIRGKYASLGVSSEELHRERQADDQKSEHELRGLAS